MPFNGTGSFVSLAPPTFPAVDGTTIESDQLNLNLDDIFNGLSACVTRDGQSPVTANQPMATFKHTNAGAATNAGQYLVYGQTAAALTSLAVTTLTVNGVPVVGNYLPLNGGNLTGDLTVDTTVFVTDIANDRIGINVAVPLYTLHLTSGEATPLYTNSSASGGSVNRFAWNGTDRGYVGNGTNAFSGVADTDFGIGSATGQRMLLSVDGGRTILLSDLDGAISIPSPASGLALTITGVAGTNAFRVNGGASGAFVVNETGLPYGTALHNNPGAVTGTTNQYIASGTYTPTLSNLSNIAATSVAGFKWTRVGNIVSVVGQITGTVSGSGVNTSIRCTLPIPSTLAATSDLTGVVTGTSTQPAAGWITGHVASGSATIAWRTTSSGAEIGFVSFSYEIL